MGQKKKSGGEEKGKQKNDVRGSEYQENKRREIENKVQNQRQRACLCGRGYIRPLQQRRKLSIAREAKVEGEKHI